MTDKCNSNYSLSEQLLVPEVLSRQDRQLLTPAELAALHMNRMEQLSLIPPAVRTAANGAMLTCRQSPCEHNITFILRLDR